jgi:hypothetical protein
LLQEQLQAAEAIDVSDVDDDRISEIDAAIRTEAEDHAALDKESSPHRRDPGEAEQKILEIGGDQLKQLRKRTAERSVQED